MDKIDEMLNGLGYPHWEEPEDYDDPEFIQQLKVWEERKLSARQQLYKEIIKALPMEKKTTNDSGFIKMENIGHNVCLSDTKEALKTLLLGGGK